ncbi:hypothetical protein LTR50_007255 [Elasticomyces elasticus]|nr:hypothetical protein LTR50_007255 [Elasticomyces elasticus]
MIVIRPGFDVIGLALTIWLELRVTVDTSKSESQEQFNCKITYEGQGSGEVDLQPDRNLITQTALYVLRCHGQRAFPVETHLHIINPIPLGRGLGSSGAAVVAGAVLANEVGRLDLSKERLLDFCLMIERHPDNVAAALYGGFVGTYLSELQGEDLKRIEIPLSEVLPSPAGGVDTGLRPPIPPLNIGHHQKFQWAKEIKCIAVIPDFEVSTAKARAVLPTVYSRADLVFNMQRIALMTTALGQSPPNPDMIYEGMQDKVHQPYRKTLIPGLTEVLQSVTPKSHPGLLGICLSGAGPTILALATDNFEKIAEHILEQFKNVNITCEWKLLEPAEDGATVLRDGESSAGGALTYATAGVSIDAGNELVRRIKKTVSSTKRPGTDAEIGGFGGAIDLYAAGYKESPVIIQAIDGIGTKLKVAFAMNKYDTIGIDLVAMNVNDLVVQGAEPLTFMDYYATSSLDVEIAAKFVEGVAAGCKEAGCALIGGETAEMPGMYTGKDFDAAGAATGAIARGQKILPDKDSMVEGDVLLGLASNGTHSNGYSLIRKIVERNGLMFTDVAPWESSKSVGESLLTPTRIYVKSLLAATKKDLIKGMAHITGGGLIDNIPRMLPEHLAADVDVGSWTVPSIFQWLKKAGNLASAEFARTLNTGIGMVLVVSVANTNAAMNELKASGETVFKIGRLTKRSDESCVLNNVEAWAVDFTIPNQRPEPVSLN